MLATSTRKERDTAFDAAKQRHYERESRSLEAVNKAKGEKDMLLALAERAKKEEEEARGRWRRSWLKLQRECEGIYNDHNPDKICSRCYYNYDEINKREGKQDGYSKADKGPDLGVAAKNL